MVATAPRTLKSTQTRKSILDAALALFAEKGFARTTMRDIAARAGISLGLTYRYFERKEDFAAALYERMASELERVAATLPPATLAARFTALIEATIAHLEQHREAFLALAARAFDPHDAIGVLGPGTESIRVAARESWGVIIDGATDISLAAAERARLADTLYALDLLMVLVWTQDRDPARAATAEAIAAAAGLLNLAGAVLGTPIGAALLTQAASIASKLQIGRPAPAGDRPPRSDHRSQDE
jgi:AcrR family transcriptional regulator